MVPLDVAECGAVRQYARRASKRRRALLVTCEYLVKGAERASKCADLAVRGAVGDLWWGIRRHWAALDRCAPALTP
jgi:hypothetical protein